MAQNDSGTPVPSASSGGAGDAAAPANALSWLRLGPIILALVVGLQFTLWAWRTWWQRKPSQAELDKLTAMGRWFFKPDYDSRIYFCGLTLTLLLAVAVGYLWHRRLRAVRGDEQRRSAQRMLLMHFFVAGLVVFLPLLWPYSAILNLASGGLGLLFCGAAAWASTRPDLTVPRWLQWPAACRDGIEAAIVLALVALIVYIPDTAQLTGWSYTFDYHCHHVDFYVMAPALAFRHGAALGTDVYSQYGVGWPMILAFAAKFAPLSYKLWFRISLLWGCVYYPVLYLFLRLLVRSAPWALTGLLFAVWLELITGGGGGAGSIKWLGPSSTVMRYSMDVFLFSALLLHARSGNAWLGLPAGIFAAAALLLGTETGIYLAVCLVGYLLAAPRLRPVGDAPRRIVGFAGWTLLAFVGVLLAGLAVASQGTLFRPEFWLGWTEPLRTYSDGFTHLPIGEAVKDRTCYLLLLLMLASYLFAAGRMLQEWYFRQLIAQHLIVGLVAADGLATLMLFIGRSHPYNLYHVSIPFSIVLFSFIGEIYGALWQRSAGDGTPQGGALPRLALGCVPLACLGLVFLEILTCPEYRDYPGLLRWIVKDRLHPPQIPEDNYLFAALRDGPLPDESLGDIARFREITAAMRQLSDGGRKTVAMIDEDDTHYLVEADIRPCFRYSPVIPNMAFKPQVSFLLQQIVEHPPDYLFLPSEAPMTLAHLRADDVYQSIVELVRRRFTLDRQIAGMDVYRYGQDKAAGRP